MFIIFLISIAVAGTIHSWILRSLTSDGCFGVFFWVWARRRRRRTVEERFEGASKSLGQVRVKNEVNGSVDGRETVGDVVQAEDDIDCHWISLSVDGEDGVVDEQKGGWQLTDQEDKNCGAQQNSCLL